MSLCVGVIWEASIGPLNLAAAREGEGLESHGRDPGPKVGETLMASIQPKRGSSTFIGAGREPAGVSHPGLEGCSYRPNGPRQGYSEGSLNIRGVGLDEI